MAAVSSEEPSFDDDDVGKRRQQAADDVADHARLVVGRNDHEGLADHFVEVLGRHRGSLDFVNVRQLYVLR